MTPPKSKAEGSTEYRSLVGHAYPSTVTGEEVEVAAGGTFSDMSASSVELELRDGKIQLASDPWPLPDFVMASIEANENIPPALVVEPVVEEPALDTPTVETVEAPVEVADTVVLPDAPLTTPDNSEATSSPATDAIEGSVP